MDDIIRKTFEIGESKAIDPEHGIYEAWISTEAIDRDGDIMVAEGADIENYMKNPVVLFGHSYRDPNAVVGKTLGLHVDRGKGIRARWQFAPPEANWNAQTVHRLWAGGFLNATSIGFIPKDWEPRELDESGQPVDRGRRFKKWELLEYSIVTVPSQQEALRLAVKALEFAEPTFTEDLEEEEDKSECCEDEILDVHEVKEEQAEPDKDIDDELTEAELDELADIVSDITEDLKR